MNHRLFQFDENFVPSADEDITLGLYEASKKIITTHKGPVWTTDALFKETKEVVNSYIEKGAICVDMVSATFFTIANIYKKRTSAILAVSDNLISGEMGFSDFRFFDAQRKMIDIVYEHCQSLEV